MFAVLLVRDFIILSISYKHLGKFIAKGNDVTIGILRKSKFQDDIAGWLPDIELELKYKLGIPVLYITSGTNVIFKQYPIGAPPTSLPLSSSLAVEVSPPPFTFPSVS